MTGVADDDLEPPLLPGLDEAFGAAAEGESTNPRRRDGPGRKAKPPPVSLSKLIEGLAYRHSGWQVFADFAEMAAIALSNAVDRPQCERRETRYLEIVRRYEPEEVAKFPQMLALLTEELEREGSDVLGRTFHELELHNKWAGQFFSPYPLCQMMARMVLGDEDAVREKVQQRGFITAQEPACGSGAMVIALAMGLQDLGINYQQHLHVTAIDVDAKCVHMAYVQLALLHIPAVIIHGNTLSLEEYGRWYTPAHILGGWGRKLKRAAEAEPGGHIVTAIPAPKPMSGPEEPEAPAPSQLKLF